MKTETIALFNSVCVWYLFGIRDLCSNIPTININVGYRHTYTANTKYNTRACFLGIVFLEYENCYHSPITSVCVWYLSGIRDLCSKIPTKKH